MLLAVYEKGQTFCSSQYEWFGHGSGVPATALQGVVQYTDGSLKLVYTYY
jgi:hypothetical protein